MKTARAVFYIISRELFRFSLIVMMVFLLAENIRQGSVTDYFNMNYLYYLVIISGFTAAVTYKDAFIVYKRKKMSGVDFQNYLLIATAGGFLMFSETRSLGKLSLVLSALTAGMILLFSILRGLQAK